MVYALLLACVMAAPDEAGTVDSNLHAYKEARAVAGRDADAHVRLALWCEARGLIAERTKHLTIATLIDPNHAAARGLLGMVRYKGQWLSPDAVAARIQADPERQARIREYLQRRPKAADKADDQLKLALWCEQNGLEDQAVAHFHRAVQLDPGRETAWKHLGYRKEKGRWVKPEQIAAEREFLELQAKADRHWRPILEKLRAELSSKKAEDREKARAELDAIGDPAAVPMIWATFARGDARRQEVAVELFGRIDSPYASKSLAMLAVDGRSPEVRRGAVTQLKRKDPRDFADVLIALIRKPIEYEVRRPVGTGTAGELFVKGPNQNWIRRFTPLTIPVSSVDPMELARVGFMGDTVLYDEQGLPVIRRWFNNQWIWSFAPGTNMAGMNFPFRTINYQSTSSSQLTSALQRSGLSPQAASTLGEKLASQANSPAAHLLNDAPRIDPVGALGINPIPRFDIPIGQMMLDVQDSAKAAQFQLDQEVKRIENYNRPIRETNRQARQVLSDSIGLDLGDDPAKWHGWYMDILGFGNPENISSSAVPTTVEEASIDYIPRIDPRLVDFVPPRPFHSCFAAGTAVRTIDGPRPIESLKAGDMVLTQNATSGQIGFSPVINPIHNPPNDTLRIRLAGSDDPVVATGIHRFWKVGQGWAMARDLKPGDTLRAIGGALKVASIEPDRKQPVFNLRVAEGESFFVGDPGLLAHDNSLVAPVEKPFDQVGSRDVASADRK